MKYLFSLLLLLGIVVSTYSSDSIITRPRKFKIKEVVFDFSSFDYIRSKIISDKGSKLIQFYEGRILDRKFKNLNQLSFGLIGVRYNFRLKTSFYIGEKFYFESYNYIQPQIANLNNFNIVSNNTIVNTTSNRVSIKIYNQIFSNITPTTNSKFVIIIMCSVKIMI